MLVPIAVSIYTLLFLFNFLDGILHPILKPIFGAYLVPGVSLLVTFLLILGLGALASNALGRRALGYVENVFSQIPVLRVVYSSVKQACSTFLAGNSEFKKVVLIEYPRKNCYVLGFVTSSATTEVQEKTKEDVLNVFIPTSPNPTSGFLLLVPRKDVTQLDMSVDEGLKLIVSGGFFKPTDRLEAVLDEP